MASCDNKNINTFENILYATNSLKVKNIESLDEDGSVVIEGYTSVDEYITVNLNCNETIFTGNPSFYGYIADRSIEVVAVGEIHENGGQAGSEISVSKRLIDLSSLPLITPNLPADSADNTSQSGILVGANVQLVKGEAIFISAVGDMTDLEGCVVSVLLKIPA